MTLCLLEQLIAGTSDANQIRTFAVNDGANFHPA
jgi:hypothetical protein